MPSKKLLGLKKKLGVVVLDIRKDLDNLSALDGFGVSDADEAHGIVKRLATNLKLIEKLDGDIQEAWPRNEDDDESFLECEKFIESAGK